MKNPGFWEPGFFIDVAAPPYRFMHLEPPPGQEWRFIHGPDNSLCPSLYILPDTEVFRSFDFHGIPVLYYKQGEYGIPLSLDYGRYFTRNHYLLPGGYVAAAGKGLICRGETLLLTERERVLFTTLLMRPDKYLSLEEIKRLTGQNALKVPISRLRTKVNDFLSCRCPLQINFHPVRRSGYYLGITVDNLWKTV